MSNLSFDLQEQLMPALRAGDLKCCELTVIERLFALPRSPFHIASDLCISNTPADVAAYFDSFFQQQPRSLISAAYTEMNGFDINPSLWFCSPFAYQRYGGHDDYDWLSNWQSDYYDNLTIHGLEPLQQIYASSAKRDEHFSDAESASSLLVVIKFQDLIRRSAPLMRERRFPLLVTAHDYDIIYEVPA
jgi:hypothetical protein